MIFKRLREFWASLLEVVNSTALMFYGMCCNMLHDQHESDRIRKSIKAHLFTQGCGSDLIHSSMSEQLIC